MAKVTTGDRQVRPSEAAAALEVLIDLKCGAMLWGPPGIGKSDVIAQIAEAQGRKLRDIRLNLMESTDLRGIPFLNTESNKMDWGQPSEFPESNDPECNDIILLDELNSAPQTVQAAAYQLILNRRVGPYVLPPNVAIVAAGNRDSDKGVTFRMPTPLANRMVHVEMKADLDDWKLWAITNKVHPDVVAFLSYSPKHLFNFEPTSGLRSFPTPRSWSFVSRILYRNPDQSTLTTLISGAVGEGVTAEFSGFLKTNSKLPNPMDVLTGKVTKLEYREVSAQFSLALNLIYLLSENHSKLKEGKIKEEIFLGFLDNFLGFSMKNLEKEIVIMSLRNAMTVHKLPLNPAKLKNMKQVVSEYGKVLQEIHDSNDK